MAEPHHPDTTLLTDTDTDRSGLLRVTAREHGDDLVVLTAYGEIDLSNTWVLDSELARHEHVPRLVIDMSHVDFCAISGARLLQTAVTRSVVTGQRVEIVHSKAVARVLDATGLAAGIPRRAQADIEVEQAERGLRGYAHQVATAVGSGPEGTVAELEPEPSIYVALNARSAAHPGDVALVWTAGHGWAVAMEASAPDLTILDYLGPDPLPSPAAVARFAEEVLARPDRADCPRPPRVDTTRLTARIRGYRPGPAS